MEIAFTPENAGLIIAVAKQENFHVLSSALEESARKGEELRRKSEAARQERLAQEARADRIAEIERQERETAQAVAEQTRAQIAAAAAQSEARKQAINARGRLDIAA